MPENDPASIERVGEKLKKRVDLLEITVKALITALKEAERELAEPLMPAGEYYGIKFDD